MPAIFGEQSIGQKRNPAEQALAEPNVMRKVPLSPFEQEALKNAKGIVCIYNVSPIHKWDRFTGTLYGTIHIPKAPWKFDGELTERVSNPIIFPEVIALTHDAGDRKIQGSLERGLDFVESICCCSKKYPEPDPNASLEKYGVFITEELFGKLSQKKQEAAFEMAFETFERVCRQLVTDADMFHAKQNSKFIARIHLDALKVVGEIDGEEVKRDWAPGSGGKKFKECQFCGTRLKVTVPKCSSCGEIVDQAAYARLKGPKG